MRTDYKIGIAVVLFLAVVIVVYNVFTPAGDSADSQDPGTLRPPAPPAFGQTTGSRTPSFYGTARRERVVESRGGGYTAPVAATPLTTRPVPTGDSPPPALPAPRPGRTDVASAERTRPDPAPGARQRTYLVEEGDNGFWRVSEKMYGHGKYWHLIKEANPSVGNVIHPGQELMIPPLPRMWAPCPALARAPTAPWATSGWGWAPCPR